MTDLSKHKKNISTYNMCTSLIQRAIEDLYYGKAKGVRTGTSESIDDYLDTYYEHLERIKKLKDDYLTQNNLYVVE